MAVETRTGGREATSGVIGGGTALAVGDPGTPAPPGFAWTELLSVARLETGHTPSRRHPEYWNGGIPWIGIKDATANYGRTIYSTNQTVTEAGIANSSARMLPAGTVCLSRTASVGYVIVMGVPMATSQDFVNWVCGPDLDRRYLKYVLQLERETLLRFASGTTHQTIYFPEAKAFHVLLPGIDEQRAIADVLGVLDEKIESNRRISEAIASVIEAEYSAATAGAGAAPASRWLDVHMGSPFAGDRFEQPGVGRPLIRIRDLKTFEPQVWTSEHREDEKVVQPGDVLVGMDAEFRSTLWLSVAGVLNQRVVTIQVAGAGGIHGLPAKSWVRASRAPMSCLRVVER